MNEDMITEEIADPKNIVQNSEYDYFSITTKRYKTIFNRLLSLSKEKNTNDLLITVTSLLTDKFDLEKAIVIDLSLDEIILSTSGYKDEDKILVSKNKDNIINLVQKIFILEESGAVYTDSNSENSILAKENLLLSNFLACSLFVENKKIYIFAGFKEAILDNETKKLISPSDVYWLSLLSVSVGIIISLINTKNSLNDKQLENKALLDQHDKEIEERTRSLLDALFDAKKFRLALELADVIVILVDASSRKIIYANELFEITTGFKRDIIVLKKTLEILNLIPLEITPELFSSDFDNLLRDIKAVRGGYVCTTEGGDEREIMLSVSRFDEDGGGSIYVLIGRDVTDERDVLKREREHAEDIEKLNQLIVNRELRIIELKQKIAKMI